LTLEQVVERFPTMTPQHLYDTRHRGRAPGILARRIGKFLVWDTDELAEWWAAGAPPQWPDHNGEA
jgi:hypothetical protein